MSRTSDGNTAELWVPTGSATVRVPGKVNLYLAVGDRRDDGYHELTTVFHAVSLVDEVTVRNADLLSLEVVGEGADKLPTDKRNLAWQAAELMAEHVGRAPDVSIFIDKSIPVAGGMAGGSADAAAVLVAMNSLWELNLPRRDLRMLAAQLGSDVPLRCTAVPRWARAAARNWRRSCPGIPSTGCWRSHAVACPPRRCSPSWTGSGKSTGREHI